MSFIIDIIGATVASAILVITIIGTIFKIHEMNYNIQILLAMNQHSQQVVEALDYYLEKPGKFMTSGAVFDVAADSIIVFKEAESYGSPNLITYSIFALAETGDAVRDSFVVNVHDTSATPVLLYDTEPFYVANNEIFTYYGYDITTTPPTFIELPDPPNVDQIRAVRVDLVFHTPTYDVATGRNIVYHMQFWRYFKNVYIINKIT